MPERSRSDLNAALTLQGSTKKAVTSGAIFVGYNVGNIAASYTVKTPEASIKYRSTWITVIVAMVVASIAALALRWLLVRENRRRDEDAAKQRETNVLSSGEPTLPSTPSPEGQGGDVEKGTSTSTPAVPPGAVLKALDDYVDLTDKQLPHFRYTL